MIAVGSRKVSPQDYNVLEVFRLICARVPGAYVESVKTADDAANQRAVTMMKGDLTDEIFVESVVESERAKVERWGGVVLTIKLRGSAEGLVAFVGPRQVMICGDGKAVEDAVITGIASDFHAAGFPEVVLQR